MWGVEAAVVVLACSVALMALLTAPWWMRILTSLVAYFSTELDHVENETREQAVYPKEEK